MKLFLKITMEFPKSKRVVEYNLTATFNETKHGNRSNYIVKKKQNSCKSKLFYSNSGASSKFKNTKSNFERNTDFL